MKNLSLRMLDFAREKHEGQLRKYTFEPYIHHPIGVCAIVAPYWNYDEKVKAVAYGHDLMEDCGVTFEDLVQRFGVDVAHGVRLLSDLDKGNRATRKALTRERLADAPAWVQDIKVADIIHNMHSIVEHDPKFAKVFISEVTLLLDVLTSATEELMLMARAHIEQYKLELGI